MRVRLEVALSEWEAGGGNCNKTQGKKEEQREGDRDSKKRRSRLQFFFFFSLVQDHNCNQPFKRTPPPFQPTSFILFTMIAARTRPTICMASAAKPAPAKVGRASEERARGLRAGANGYSIDALPSFFFLCLALLREASQKEKAKNALFSRGMAPSSGAWFGPHSSHGLEPSATLSPVHCMRHSQPRSDPARGYE